LPFLLTSTPAFLLAILVLCTAKEPVRGGQEEEIVKFNKRVAALAIAHSTAVTNALHNHPNNNSYSAMATPSARTPCPQQLTTIASFEEQNRFVVAAEEKEQHAEGIDCSKILSLFSTPTVFLILLQGLPGCIPWGMVYVFLNDYLSANRGNFVLQTFSFAY
jgi:hypothetical protein